MMRLLLILLAAALLALAGCSATIAETDLPAPGTTGLYEVARTGESITVSGPIPTPTVTVTATPLPGPTVTVTAAPSATPAPSPTWVTMKDARLASGTVYENVVFTGGSSTRGVLHLNYALSNVVLRNCIIDTGPQNGITVNASDSATISNLTLEDVTVRPQPRMGIEFTDRSATAARWRDVTLTRVTVEPSGSEAMSFDQNSKTAVNLLVKDCLIKGSGTRPDLYPWGQGFELNAPKAVTVDGLTIWQTRGAAFNLTGPGAGVQSGWVLKNLTVDMRIRDPLQTQNMSSTAQVLYMKNASGARFTGLIAAGGTGAELGYLDNCTGNDFSGVTWVDTRRTPQVTQKNGSGSNVGLP